MSRQSKLFDRAAECERLMNLASDPVNKETLKELRDMWTALANDATSSSAQEMATTEIILPAGES
jgi:hypothetical protein